MDFNGSKEIGKILYGGLFCLTLGEIVLWRFQFRIKFFMKFSIFRTKKCFASGFFAHILRLAKKLSFQNVFFSHNFQKPGALLFKEVQNFENFFGVQNRDSSTSCEHLMGQWRLTKNSMGKLKSRIHFLGVLGL